MNINIDIQKLVQVHNKVSDFYPANHANVEDLEYLIDAIPSLIAAVESAAAPQPAQAALSDAINDLMDFAPCKRAQPDGMTRGGPYVQKADVLNILAASQQPAAAPVQPLCKVCNDEGMVWVMPNEQQACTACQDIGDDSDCENQIGYRH